jgi:hypothetical protein
MLISRELDLLREQEEELLEEKSRDNDRILKENNKLQVCTSTFDPAFNTYQKLHYSDMCNCFVLVPLIPIPGKSGSDILHSYTILQDVF